MKISTKNVKENSIFTREKGGDDEKKKRKLILLDYTDQEKLAGGMPDNGKEENKAQGPPSFYFSVFIKIVLNYFIVYRF